MNNIIATPILVPAEVNLGGTSTANRMFISSATTGANNPTASQPIVLRLPSSGQLAGTAATSGTFTSGTQVYNAAFTTGNQDSVRRSVRFRILAHGRVVTSGTLNFTVTLHYVTSLTSVTIASAGSLATSSTVSLASLTTNWQMEAVLLYDAVSQRLTGYYFGQVHNTNIAVTTITNPQTSVDLTTAGGVYGFVVTTTFGTGAAGNAAYLDGFFLFID